jgi:archaellum component FlaC
LLNQAKSPSDIFSLERQVKRLKDEIEDVEGQIKSLEGQTAADRGRQYHQGMIKSAEAWFGSRPIKKSILGIPTWSPPSGLDLSYTRTMREAMCQSMGSPMSPPGGIEAAAKKQRVLKTMYAYPDLKASADANGATYVDRYAFSTSRMPELDDLYSKLMTKLEGKGCIVGDKWAVNGIPDTKPTEGLKVELEKAQKELDDAKSSSKDVSKKLSSLKSEIDSAYDDFDNIRNALRQCNQNNEDWSKAFVGSEVKNPFQKDNGGNLVFVIP